MSFSSRSGLLKVVGGAATVVVAFVLIGAGVQLARNAEGYEVKTGALDEIAGAPATVIDDAPASEAPTPPVVEDPGAPVAPTSPSGNTPPPGGGSGPGDGTGGDDGGGDDPSDPVTPPELDPIIGLVDDITGATTETLDGTNESNGTLIDSTTETLDDTTSSLGL